jgi:hypothetical protein
MKLVTFPALLAFLATPTIVIGDGCHWAGKEDTILLHSSKEFD